MLGVYHIHQILEMPLYYFQIVPDSLISGQSDSLHILIENSAKQDNTVQILTLVIALLAVVVGPAIQFFINRKQIRTQLETVNKTLKAEVRSANRQSWINDLRNTISDFISLVYTFSLQNEETEHTEQKIIFRELMMLKSKIELMLNPGKKDQKEIIDLINKITSNLAEKPKTEEEKKNFLSDFIDSLTDLSSKSQKLFSLHWKKVKNIE